MTTGEKIRKIRADKGLSMTDFCALTGISENDLSDYENDIKLPDDDTRVMLSEKLSLDAGDLVSDPHEELREIRKKSVLSPAMKFSEDNDVFGKAALKLYAYPILILYLFILLSSLIIIPINIFFNEDTIKLIIQPLVVIVTSLSEILFGVSIYKKTVKKIGQADALKPYGFLIITISFLVSNVCLVSLTAVNNIIKAKNQSLSSLSSLGIISGIISLVGLVLGFIFIKMFFKALMSLVDTNNENKNVFSVYKKMLFIATIGVLLGIFAEIVKCFIVSDSSITLLLFRVSAAIISYIPVFFVKKFSNLDELSSNKMFLKTMPAIVWFVYIVLSILMCFNIS